MEDPMLALALALLLPTTSPAATPSADDPPIRVKLSDDEFTRGDRAKVKVKAAEDGYLVVLRADGSGRIRVLYPLSPDDSGKIRGGREFEVRSRGDREAFVVDEEGGYGTVLAAVSAQPFRFDEFARGAHWDYRALAAADSVKDAEAALLDVVDRMATGHYDYDVVTYTVVGGSERAYSRWYGPWYHGYYDTYYPYYPYPYFGYPFYGPRYGFSATLVFGRSHFYGRPFFGGRHYYRKR
jgi:hypothetical protein